MKSKIEPVEKSVPNDTNPCDYCGCEMRYGEETVWKNNRWFHDDCLEMKDMIGDLGSKNENPDFLVIDSVKVVYS